jgi:hypothetical protein
MANGVSDVVGKVNLADLREEPPAEEGRKGKKAVATAGGAAHG